MRYVLIAIMLSVAFFSCDESSVSEFVLEDAEFESVKEDSLTVYVDNLSSPIKFTGELNIYDGQCEIVLYTPEYDTLYTEADTTYIAADTSYIAADTSYVVADTLYTETDTTYIAADTTYIVADTLYTLADTFFIPVDTILERVVAYNQVFKANEEVEFSEEFEPILGEWEFFYFLDENDDEAPYGNFEFVFKYSD